MASTTHHYFDDTADVVLDDETWQGFTSDEANSLLRILVQAEHGDERTYSSVSMFPVADGHNLYVLPH